MPGESRLYILRSQALSALLAVEGGPAAGATGWSAIIRVVEICGWMKSSAGEVMFLSLRLLLAFNM